MLEYCSLGSVRDIIETCNVVLNEDQIAVVCLNTLKVREHTHLLSPSPRGCVQLDTDDSSSCLMRVASYRVSCTCTSLLSLSLVHSLYTWS